MLLAVILGASPLLQASVKADRAAYVGGTAPIPRGAEGVLSTEDIKVLSFDGALAKNQKEVAAYEHARRKHQKANQEADKKEEAKPAPATDPAKPADPSAPVAWRVSYDKITSFSYGQHSGRRVGATIALGVAVGVAALPMLFSKKRRHYLTVQYLAEDASAQAAVFEVGKDSIKILRKSLEARTGKKIEYEDDDARKSVNK